MVEVSMGSSSENNNKKKCIIVPAFDESENIAAVLKDIREYSDAEIVVVDDGSKDRTGSKAAAAGVTVIRHPFNMGYGVALQTGYKWALKKGYEFLVQIDADGQHDPKYIPALFEEVEKGQSDVAIGSRFLIKGGYEAGPAKTIGIGFFRILIWIACRKRITDPTSGYQCLNRTVFGAFTKDLFPTDYPDADVILMLYRMGYRVREVPVTMVPNPTGRSMHRGIFRLMYYFFKMGLSFFVTILREKK
jgi:glycosyltransferase involved in cell wall biosynthesis